MTVSPSASLWYSRHVDERARRRPPIGRAAVVLVAGPKVAQAEEEIRRIRSSFYPRARVLQGSSATARRPSRAPSKGAASSMSPLMGPSAPTTRSSPRWSWLTGRSPSTTSSVSRRPPEWMVLSACDAGRSEVHPGDELMGTSAALAVARDPRHRLQRRAGTLRRRELGHVRPCTKSSPSGAGWLTRWRPHKHAPFPRRSRFADLASDDSRAREALALPALLSASGLVEPLVRPTAAEPRKQNPSAHGTRQMLE